MNNTEQLVKKYTELNNKISKISPKKKQILFIIFCAMVFFALFISPVISIFLIVAYIGIKATIKHFAFMKRFANENNLNYEFSIPSENLSGRLFSISNSEFTSNVLSGIHNETPIKIFNYQYTVGSGDNSRTYSFTISEITTEKTNFPYILLKSNSMPHYNSIDLFKKEKDIEISLEPEFKKTYSLYTNEGYEIEALQIFTADLLMFLRENGSHFSIEFANNKIYVYDDKLIRDEKDLSILLDLTKKIIEKIGPFLNRLHDDFSALHAYYKK